MNYTSLSLFILNKVAHMRRRWCKNHLVYCLSPPFYPPHCKLSTLIYSSSSFHTVRPPLIYCPSPLYTICPPLYTVCSPLHTVRPLLYTVRPLYILSVSPYILSVPPYILSVSPFILSVPPYILSVMQNIFLSLIEALYRYSAEFLEQIGSLSRGTIVSDSLTQ